MASNNWSIVVPLGSRRKMSDMRSSSSSMVKPCTIDQARTIAPACSSDSASASICSWRLAPIARAKPANEALAACVQRRPRHVEPLGAEHQPVHAGMRLRIGDIGLCARHRLFAAACRQALAAIIAALNLRVADRGEFAEKPREVAEMMRRRGMRDARLARDRAQGQARQPVAFQHFFGRLQQRIAQGAVMIGRIAGCAGTPHRLLCR